MVNTALIQRWLYIGLGLGLLSCQNPSPQPTALESLASTKTQTSIPQQTINTPMAPILTHLSTSSGLGGSSLTLLGSGFTSAATVHMGEQVVPISQISENQITVRVPHGLSGIQPVTVHNGQNRSQAFLFTVEGMVSTVVGAKTKLPSIQLWPNPIEKITLDSFGNIYAIRGHQIVKVDLNNKQVIPIAGTGTDGFSGDGGPATQAQLKYPSSIVFDQYGDLYILDNGNGRIRKISKNFSIITTIFGDAKETDLNDLKLIPFSARLMAADAYNQLYLIQNNQILRFNKESKTLSVVAGTTNEGFSGDGGPAHLAQLYQPVSLTFDSFGNMYIADQQNHRIRKIDHSSGIITTVAGTGDPFIDGRPLSEKALQTNLPPINHLAMDRSNNLYLGGSFLQKFDTTSGQLTTVIQSGSGSNGNGSPVHLASLWGLRGLAIDQSGNVLIAEQYEIRKIDKQTGIIDSLFSSPFPSFDGPVNQAEIHFPQQIIFDQSSNIYFVDEFGHRIYKIDHLTGVVSTIAGTGINGFSGDGGQAINARLNGPSGIALDSQNNLYIADGSNARIRKVDRLTGLITTLAGNGTEDTEMPIKPANTSKLRWPTAITLDATDNVYFADFNLIRKIDKISNVLTTVKKVSNDLPGIHSLAINSTGLIYAPASNMHYIYKIDEISGVQSNVTDYKEAIAENGDGGPAIDANLSYPSSIAFDHFGNLYISDRQNHRIRMVESRTGNISTVLGTGEVGISGDGDLAVQSRQGFPMSIAVDKDANLYIADSDHHIRKIDKQSGRIYTIAGTGIQGFSGDGGPANKAQISHPCNLKFDQAGNLYFCDYGRKIRSIDLKTGIISTYLGFGEYAYSPDGTHRSQANTFSVSNFTFDPNDNLYFSESSTVRKIDRLTGLLSTVLGKSPLDVLSGGLNHTQNQLSSPGSLVVNDAGELFISDDTNYAILKVDIQTGMITKIAGIGLYGFSGDGGPATQAKIGRISSLALDPFGNLYLADAYINRIRKIDKMTGLISTVVGTDYMKSPNDQYPSKKERQSELSGLIAIALDKDDNLFIADSGNHQIRKVDKATGLISTVAGIGGQGFSPDNVIATQINLSNPSSIAFDPAGNLHISDSGNHRIVKVHF